MSAKFEVFVGKNQEYYFRLKASNGQIILGSEGYKSRSGCMNGIASVKKNASDDMRYKRKVARNGQHYFTLIAANYQVIGKSETYTSTQALETGVKSVRTGAPSAAVVVEKGTAVAKVASAKKAAPAKKAAASKKTAPAKKAASGKAASAAKKPTVAKKPAAATKPATGKKPAAVKKPAASKKPAAAKKPAAKKKK